MLSNDPTEASGNSRVKQCAWYKMQANAAGRAGDKTKKNLNWQLYSQCMRDQID
jgi:hypothetical protein